MQSQAKTYPHDPPAVVGDRETKRSSLWSIDFVEGTKRFLIEVSARDTTYAPRLLPFLHPLNRENLITIRVARKLEAIERLTPSDPQRNSLIENHIRGATFDVGSPRVQL